MKVTPISEADAAEAGLRKRGIYDFEVTDAEEKESSKGNDMIELKVKLFDAEGRSFWLYDYLVASEGMAYKVRHFAAATDMLPQYEKGDLKAIDCVGKTGRCQLGVEPAKNNYPAKNKITDYVPNVQGRLAPLIASKAPEEMDDEIPF